MKKLTLLAALLVMTAAIVTAQEPPKVGLEFKQQMDASWSDGKIAPTKFSSGTDTGYTRTEIKGKATFTFDAFSLTPWVKDRFEVRMNSNGNDTGLSSFRFRNRLYLGIDAGYKITDALNLMVNMEYRVANDLKTSSGAEGYVAPEHRLSPYVGVSGKAGDLSYGVGSYFHFYLQSAGINGDEEDSKVMDYEIEANINLAYTVKMNDSTKFVFSLDVFPGYEFENDFSDAMLYNTADLKATMVMGGFSLVAGATSDIYYNMTEEEMKDAILIGAILGTGFSKDNWAFTFEYRVGQLSGEGIDEVIQGWATAAIKVKI